MKGDIANLMFVYLNLKSLFQKSSDAGGYFIFFIKHDTNVIGQWIADLLSVLNTSDSKIQVICHRKNNGTIYFSEFFFCLIQYCAGKLQAVRGNALHNSSGISSVCQFCKGINTGIFSRLNTLPRFLTECNSLSHYQIFLVTAFFNSDK